MSDALTRPIAFPVDGPAADASPGGTVRLATRARSASGMQKEAVVTVPGGRAWNLLCDEGPTLNGADLAPFPLGWFSAGLAASVMDELGRIGGARGLDLDALEIVVDSYYRLEGSFLRETMRGFADPPVVSLRAPQIDPEARLGLAQDAVLASPVFGLVRGALPSAFALFRNGTPLDDGGASESSSDMHGPADLLDRSAPEAADVLVEKVAERDAAVPTGRVQGTSLADEQKRAIHVRARSTLRSDGLRQTDVGLIAPPGSTFRILSGAPNGADRAPRALALASAGLAFCFMTQIGRYAHVAKLDLASYGVAQDTAFDLSDAAADPPRAAQAHPVATQAFLETDVDEDGVRRIARMAERTCFLHALCRSPLRTKVRIER